MAALGLGGSGGAFSFLGTNFVWCGVVCSDELFF